MSDHYALLGVARDADDDAIRDAYYRAMRASHPDVAGDAAPRDLAYRLNAAFDILSDPHERAAYDRELVASTTSVPAARRSGEVAHAASPLRREVRRVAGSEPLPISWIIILAIVLNLILLFGLVVNGAL